MKNRLQKSMCSIISSMFKNTYNRSVSFYLNMLMSAKNQTKVSSVQSLSRVRLFATPWTTAPQASLSITNSRILLKPMSTESVMPSNHLILCHPLILLPSIIPSIRVFSNESVLRIRWPKYWSFSFSISPSNEYSGLISFRQRSRRTQIKLPWRLRRDQCRVLLSLSNLLYYLNIWIFYNKNALIYITLL